MDTNLIPELTPELTPEQARAAQLAFSRRKFDPDEYQRSLMGHEPSPEMQVAIAAGELAEIDSPSTPTPEAEEEWRRRKEKSDLAAREFCFLDPKDYAGRESRPGRVLTPQQFLDLLTTPSGCGLQAWFSLGSEALVRKELTPRDVALAKLKIGENPDNLQDTERWRAAIADVRQEENKRVPLRSYPIFALQVCRKPQVPEYCCWLPGCDLREYDLVGFDEHGVPQQHIHGWRTACLELVRKGFTTEERITRTFGEATGPDARRYLEIMAGLRNRPWRDEEESTPTTENLYGETSQETIAKAASAEETERAGAAAQGPGTAQGGVTPAVTPCLECHHRFAHFSFCSQYDAWLNGAEAGAKELENPGS